MFWVSEYLGNLRQDWIAWTRRMKYEITEDEKYHNLMSWLISGWDQGLILETWKT